MRKFLMLAAVVALVAAALAVPAMAQRNDDNDNFDRFDNNAEFFDFFGDRFDNEEEFFDFFDNGFDDNGFEQEPVVGQEIGQEAESGDVAIGFDVSSTGDYAQQCVAPMQFGNTGNLQNAQGFVQYGSSADDVEFEGSSFEFSPAMMTSCDQAVQQSSAASSYGY